MGDKGSKNLVDDEVLAPDTTKGVRNKVGDSGSIRRKLVNNNLEGLVDRYRGKRVVEAYDEVRFDGLKIPDIVGLDTSDEVPLQTPPENLLAMVLFCGNDVKEMTSGINKLNLKRNAGKDWDSVQPKRRKLSAVDPNSKPEISVFASNLRKVKARAKRYSRKKGRMEKENIPFEGERYDEEMVDEEASEFILGEDILQALVIRVHFTSRTI
ncbi:hypothetical protein K1719_006359 [Acacia pycnantha]|nr:hypothetical protein K1719_006359 [Acacia pycnantha]